MVGISNIYMDRVLSALSLKHYCGVYSIDTIPNNLMSQNFLIILNFSPHNATGTHFVCLCQTKVGPRSRIYLFDSLATPFNSLPALLQQIMSDRSASSILPFPIQDLFSEHCGFYAMYFIIFLSLPSQLQKNFSPLHFSTNPSQLLSNDALCIDMISRLIKAIKTD